MERSDDAGDIAAGRWVTAQFDPLVSARQRIYLEHQMRVWVTAKPRLAAAWFSGVLWQVVSTWPADDPWRQLTVQWDDGDLEKCRGRTPHQQVGVFAPDGSPFGLIECALDVVFPASEDVQLDPARVALDGGLSTRAGSVMALAVDGYEHAYTALLHVASMPRHEEDLLDVGSAALRWALWRRRVYVGSSDPYPLLTAQTWFTRAERVIRGEPIDIRGCEFEIEVERVDNGAWADMNGMVRMPPFFPRGH